MITQTISQSSKQASKQQHRLASTKEIRAWLIEIIVFLVFGMVYFSTSSFECKWHFCVSFSGFKFKFVQSDSIFENKTSRSTHLHTYVTHTNYLSSMTIKIVQFFSYFERTIRKTYGFCFEFFFLNFFKKNLLTSVFQYELHSSQLWSTYKVI